MRTYLRSTYVRFTAHSAGGTVAASSTPDSGIAGAAQVRSLPNSDFNDLTNLAVTLAGRGGVGGGDFRCSSVRTPAVFTMNLYPSLGHVTRSLCRPAGTRSLVWSIGYSTTSDFVSDEVGFWPKPSMTTHSGELPSEFLLAEMTPRTDPVVSIQARYVRR